MFRNISIIRIFYIASNSIKIHRTYDNILSEIQCIIEEILWIMPMAANNIIISINTKMTIKMFATNNRIIIKESFAQFW